MRILIDDTDKLLLRQYPWRVQKNGYVTATINGKSAYLHRLIMDAPKGQEIDHINNKPWDNRRANLRFATRELQLLNRQTSKGAYYDKSVGEYKAYFKRKYLGYFKNLEDAMGVQAAYKAKYIEENF